jgi:hypothetical protein
MTTATTLRIRASTIQAGDHVQYRYKGQDHWSMTVISNEDLNDGTVRIHLPFGFTMRYKRRAKVHVMREPDTTLRRPV